MIRLTQFELTRKINDHMRGLKSDYEIGHRLQLRYCDLTNIDLSNMDLRGAVFDECRLHNVDFTNTNLAHAVFLRCDMRGAKVTGTNFEGAEFHKTNVSSANGHISNKDAMNKFFYNDGSGYIVYTTSNKLCDDAYPVRGLVSGSVIEDPFYNRDRSKPNGYGIDCGDMQYAKKLKDRYGCTIWRCRILNEWADEDYMVCVPYNSYGFMRCRRVELIETM